MGLGGLSAVLVLVFVVVVWVYGCEVVVVVEIGCSLWEELEQEWNLRARMRHLRVLVFEIGTGIEELYVGRGGGSGCELLDQRGLIKCSGLRSGPTSCSRMPWFMYC